MAFSSANVFWLVISIAFSCRGIISVCSQETNCSRRIARGYSDKRKIHSGFPPFFHYLCMPDTRNPVLMSDDMSLVFGTGQDAHAGPPRQWWRLSYESLVGVLMIRCRHWRSLRSKWTTLLRLFASASHACRLNTWPYDSASYWYLRLLQ